jgi:hypothetical protein
MNNLTTEKLFAILIRMFAVGELWNAIDIFTLLSIVLNDLRHRSQSSADFLDFARQP